RGGRQHSTDCSSDSYVSTLLRRCPVRPPSGPSRRSVEPTGRDRCDVVLYVCRTSVPRPRRRRHERGPRRGTRGRSCTNGWRTSRPRYRTPPPAEIELSDEAARGGGASAGFAGAAVGAVWGEK